MKRDRFIFYSSFYESSQLLDEVSRCRFYEAIFKYSLDDEEEELDGIVASMFGLVKPVLDAQVKRVENGKKGAKFGKLGGRPSKTTKKPKDEEKPTKKAEKPTLENVQEYITEMGYSVNAEAFFNYYESNGWKVGKNPMKDWKACVRTWNAKENNSTQKRKVILAKKEEELPKTKEELMEEEKEKERLLELLKS